MTESANGDVLTQNGSHSTRKRNSKVAFRDTSVVAEAEEDKRVKNKNGPPYSNGLKRSISHHSLSDYLVALRPWSFPATLTPVALGSMLYYKETNSFNITFVWTLLISCMTALCVHAAGNLVNTYFDYKKGVDSQKSDDRTLVDHLLEPNAVATMGAVFYCLGCVGFILTVVISPATLEDLALVFFGGLSSSFLYTGGLGLKYIALGDILILLTFGPITVLFTYISQGGELSLLPLVYAAPLALITEAILHSNNARDMSTDKQAGIVTLAIVLGEKGSYMLFVFLLFAPYFIFTILSVNYSIMFILPLLTVSVAFNYERDFRNGELQKMPTKIAKLNLIMGLAYVLAVVLTPKANLPGFI